MTRLVFCRLGLHCWRPEFARMVDLSRRTVTVRWVVCMRCGAVRLRGIEM